MSVEPMQGTSWQDVLARIQGLVSEQQFETWFRGIHPERCTEEAMVLVAPNAFTGEWLRKRYHGVILQAAREAFGGKEPGLDITTATGSAAASAMEADRLRMGGRHERDNPSRWAPSAIGDLLSRVPAGGGGSLRSPSRPSSSEDGPRKPHGVRLNPAFRLERLVPTPASRVTLAAADAVVNGHGSRYSPLLVHGPTGVGKTHALQGIAQAAAEQDPGLKVLFVPCEHFVNQFIAAIDARGLDAFRARYRGLDLLIVDDIHLLGEKEKSQQEFIATIEDLRLRGASMVFSSSLPPAELRDRIQNLRLQSLLTCGLDGPLAMPLFSGRLEIVRRLSEEQGGTIPDAAAQAIAEAVTSNVRELEGAVIRFLAHMHLAGAAPDHALVDHVLSDLRSGSPKVIALGAITETVAQAFKLTVDEIQGQSRAHRITLGRQAVMWLARRLTTHSLGEIGQHLGGRDHSTVLYGIERITTRMREEAELASRVGALETRLNSERR